LNQEINGHSQVDNKSYNVNDRYHSLFDNVPISLWEEDFSTVKTYLDDLRGRGIEDIRDYFENSLEDVAHCVEMVKIIDVNQITLNMYQASSKDELLKGLIQLFIEDTYNIFKEALIVLAGGNTEFESEVLTRTLKGDKRQVYLTLSVVPGYEDTWSRVLMSFADIAESKRVQEELKSSHEYLEKLNNSLQEVILTVLLPERVIDYVNNSIKNVFGYEPEECIGRKTEFLYPNKKEYNGFGDKLEAAIEEGRDALHTEHLMRRRNGEVFLAEITTTFFKEKGKITQDISILRDITGRKQAEEALREAELRYRTVADFTYDWEYWENLDGTLLYVSPSCERITGYKVDEFIANPDLLSEIIIPEDKEIWLEHKHGEASKPGEHDVQLRIRGKDGEIRWIEHACLTVIDGQGNFLGNRSSNRDITKRKQAEKALQRSEARLAEAQRIAHLGNWDWDIAINELIWSDEVYRIFGVAPQQFGVTHEAFLNYVHPEERSFVEQSINEALYEEKRCNLDYRIVRPDGRVRMVHQEAEVTLDEHHRPIRMVGTVHDITERKRAEDELRALSNEIVRSQEDERRTIASELHDEIGQSLTVLKLLLDRAMRSPAEGADSIMGEAKELINELMGQVRDLSLNLRPAMLDNLGLLQTLLWHFDQYTAKTQVLVNFKHTGVQRRFPADVRITAYRIVQEALTNVARHAEVNEVNVRAWIDQEVLWLRIEDKGAGFDSNILPIGISGGLYGMRERAFSLGGKLTIESIPAVGTIVTAELPISHD
jgi:PAS domain S-box-containing protein